MVLAFASENDRQSHPVARLIPQRIWDEVFSQQLDDFELALMTASSKNAHALLDSESFRLLDEESKQRCLVALLLSQPNRSGLFNELNQHAQYRMFDNLLHNLLLNAIQNKHINIIEHLIERLSQSALLELIGYGVLRAAIQSDNSNAFNRLLGVAPHEIMKRIEASEIFTWACLGGELNFINQFMIYVPNARKAIMYRDWHAFRSAAFNGQMDVLNRLIELVPSGNVQAMVEACGYAAFQNAASNGHLEALNRIIQLAPGKGQAMVEAGGYSTFLNAAIRGDLAILNRLIELAPDKIPAMANANSFDQIARHGYTDLCNQLLPYSGLFAHAEMHQTEYGERYVQPFTQSTLTNLRAEIAAFEQEHLNAVFDITDTDKAKLYFYIIRNLIRRNDAGLLDDMRLLLGIPAVKSLAHTAVTRNEANELLRLALTVGNRVAAEILLNIPAVRVLAEQNNFYRREQQGRFDLIALARDRESSMRALSMDEQRRLQKATARYQPKMNVAGVPNIMLDLRETLAKRYAAKPVMLTLDNMDTMPLPMNWELFNRLPLNRQERARALKAYYQHKDHSAWRYLSRPNPWMASNASYVYINPDNPTERWSTFEEYQPLISMLYLAATDMDTPPTDGMTLDTRLQHFIDELAHIGRAHNWDDTRERTDAMGRVIREEYDNLQGDKPSCYSGVNRRLFQSVIGHPLLTFLTLNGIKQELREFMREHFKQSITDANRDALGEAWAEVCATGVYGSSWDALNVSQEMQVEFLKYLATEYKTEFTDYPSFIKYVKDSFLLTPIYPAHVVRFAGETGFGNLLPLKTIKAPIDEPSPTTTKTTESDSVIKDMMARLASCGELGLSMRNELGCLDRAKTSTWPMWIGVSDKLTAITDALNNLAAPLTDEVLRLALQDNDSSLCRALSQKPTVDNAVRSKIYEILEKTPYGHK